MAHDALGEIEQAVAGAQESLRAGARQDLMRDVIIGDLDKRISRMLRSLIDGGAPFRDLLCVDRGGRVVAASDPRRLGEEWGARESVRAALAGRDFLATSPAATNGDPATVEMATPVPAPDGPGEVIGVLVGRYDWAQAMASADRTRRALVPHGLTLDFLVFDGTGTLIGETRGEFERTDAERRAGVDAAVATSGPRGYRRLPDAGVLLGWDRSPAWRVAATEPLAEAFAPVATMQRRLVIALVVVLVVALLLATAWAAQLTRPILDLTRATRAMTEAPDAPRAVVVRSRDELGLLAGSFNAMASALGRAQDDLLVAAKFAFVGEIAAGIAHEVRTPLGIMRGSAQMLVRSVPPELPECSELAGMIVEEVDRLDRVVAGLLELARPRAPVLEATQVAGVLTRALDFLEGQARDRGITVVRALGGVLPCARCDPDQLYQVALNLILNAIQVLPAGGRVTVRTIAPAAGQVGFEVADDGPGIPPELHERVFTPFFSAREGGTGLGLALVQRMVRANAGTVTIESTVGQGATFRVLLPAEPPR